MWTSLFFVVVVKQIYSLPDISIFDLKNTLAFGFANKLIEKEDIYAMRHAEARVQAVVQRRWRRLVLEWSHVRRIHAHPVGVDELGHVGSTVSRDHIGRHEIAI